MLSDVYLPFFEVLSHSLCLPNVFFITLNNSAFSPNLVKMEILFLPSEHAIRFFFVAFPHIQVKPRFLRRRKTNLCMLGCMRCLANFFRIRKKFFWGNSEGTKILDICKASCALKKKKNTPKNHWSTSGLN